MEHKVTIYSTPWCGYCKLAKDFFSKHKIKYSEYDVSTNKAKLKELIEKTQQMGVPVIEINGKLIMGFDREKVEEILGL